MTDFSPVLTATDPKPWWLSRTIIGAGIAVLAAVLKQVGVPLDDAALVELTDLALTLITAVGGTLAIYGRVKAHTPIKSGGPGAPTIVGTVLLGLMLATAGPSACASVEAQTPAQRVYAAKADFITVLPAVKAYVTRPDADQTVKHRLQQLAVLADASLDEAEAAVRAGDPSQVSTAIAAAQQAVTVLVGYLNEKGILR